EAAVVWSIAYRIGHGEGRLTVPLDLINTIVDHRVACESRDPENVARALEAALGLPDIEARRLAERAGRLREALEGLAFSHEAGPGQHEASVRVGHRAADDAGPRALRADERERPVDVAGRHDDAEADPHVERRVHLRAVDPGPRRDQLE